MKKGQGLSLNTIIIAAIVLIVLIVLWAIFTGRMGGFTTEVKEVDKDCPSVCVAAGYGGGKLSEGATCTDGSTEATKMGGKACCCT